MIKAIKFLWYVVAISLILSAIFVSAARFLTPALEVHRDKIEIWASQLLGAGVRIDNIKMAWYRYQPEIILDHVQILSKKTAKPELEIQQVKIFFSLLHSLFAWKPVPAAVVISGSKITIMKNAAGVFNIQGFPVLGGYSANPLQQTTDVSEVLNRLSAQPNLFLQDIDIRYVPSPGEALSLRLDNFKLINNLSSHLVSGKVVLLQSIPTTLTIALRWEGYVTHFSQMNAKLYCYFEGVSLPQWLANKTWFGLQAKQGIISAKVWANWEKGRWQEIQSQFTLYSLLLYSHLDKTTHTLNRISGHVGWEQNSNGQTLAGDNIFIDLPRHLWPVSAFNIAFTLDPQGKLYPQDINISYFDLHDIQPILFSSSLLTAQQKTTLKEIGLQGVVKQVKLHLAERWDDWQHTTLVSDFDQIHIQAANNIPGLSNLSGSLEWNGSKGRISLNSKALVFELPKTFALPLTFSEVIGQVQAELTPEKHWLIGINDLQISNQDFEAAVNGSVNVIANSISNVNLSADFTLNQLHHISRYLPLEMKPDLAAWLRAAFSRGHIAGKAKISGQLSDFPFDKVPAKPTRAANNTAAPGIFQVTGKLSDVTLHYAPDWPDLKHANGVLTFSGRTMSVDLDSGQIGSIPVQDVKASIPNLGGIEPEVLHLSAMSAGDLVQGLDFLRISPLKQKMGKAIKNLVLSGPMILHYSMDMPVAKPEQIKLQGKIEMDKAHLGLPAWQLALEDLSGTLLFTEDNLNATNLTGRIFAAPATLAITTVHPSSGATLIQATITGTLSVDNVQNALHLPMTHTAQGAAGFSAVLNISETAPLSAHISSNLQGIALHLPAPFNKSAPEKKPFTIDLTFYDGKPVQAIVNYMELLSAAMNLLNGPTGLQLMSGELHLGSGVASLPKKLGLLISVDLDKINLEQLKNYAAQFALPAKDTGLSSLSGINLTASKTQIAGIRLTNLRVQLMPAEGSYWNANINSQEVSGKVMFNWPLTANSHIDANFQRFFIYSDGSASQISIAPSTLPAISFVSNAMRYNQAYLGSVSFQTVPTRNGLDIESLRITTNAMSLQAKGEWNGSKGNYQSMLYGRLTASNASEVLQQWRIDANNIVLSTGQIDFDLGWNDLPFNPGVNSLSGDLSFSFGKGRIVSGQTGGAKMDLGKMLSLFSLQTLPRRLSLDFSDLFQKGYSFDSFKGNFELDDGRAHAKNMSFDGPIALVRVYGYMGLINKTYDLTISITPNVTSSVPVAATILTGLNPIVGVAAFVANSVVGRAVSRATMYYYKVTGTWSNPEWQEVSRTEARQR